MSNNGNSSKSGIGFIGLLQVAFIVLKLCGVISWSWFLIFLPTIIPSAIAIILIIILIVLKTKK